MSNPRCPICGRATTRLLVSPPDFRMGDARRYPVWACPSCGAGVTAIAMGSEAAGEDAYAGPYEPHRAVSRPARGWRGRLAATVRAGFGYPQPEALPLPAFLARALARIRAWTWAPPPPPPGRLLDVGCGSGAYGASLIRMGWEVDGIEPDARAAALVRSQGVRVQQARAEEAILPERAYDVITLWHALEHMDAPVAALRRLRAALKPEGLLIVEVPNRAGWGARLLGEFWYHWDVPRHRVHFTPESLRLALTETGFQVTRLEHIPNPYGLAGGLAYRFGRPGLARNPLILALGWGFGLAAALFHRGEVIQAVATVPKIDLTQSRQGEGAKGKGRKNP